MHLCSHGLLTLWQESAVPTPVPTPEPSVKENPPALREAPSPISTPDPSEHPSPAQSLRDSQHAQPQQPVLPGLTIFTQITFSGFW